MNPEREQFEEERETLTKEEVKESFRDVISSWREKLPHFIIKREANNVYNNREGKTSEELSEELEEALENSKEEIVKSKIDEIIEKSGILSFYKEKLHLGRVYAIGRDVIENSDEKELAENMTKALEWEYKEDIARDFFEPLLTDHIKHHLKKDSEEAETIRRETIEHLLGDINRNLYHYTSIDKERDQLQKEMIKFLKRFE